MPEEAGFTFEYVGPDTRQLSPLVLLHGSGQSETFLMSFAGRVAPERGAFALRGSVEWESGYAFFRRNADRSFDHEDLAAQCSDFCDFLAHLRALGHQKPIMIGYSNGAIMAAAAAVRAPDLSSGSILLRPLSPYPNGGFQPLRGYPVLLRWRNRQAAEPFRYAAPCRAIPTFGSRGRGAAFTDGARLGGRRPSVDSRMAGKEELTVGPLFELHSHKQTDRSPPIPVIG